VLLVNATTTQQATCPGGTDGMVQVLAQGGTGAYTYAWDNGATGAALPNIAAGSYQVTARDANNCSAVLTVQLADKTPISIQATPAPPTCIGKTDGAITVTATGGNGSFTYSWNNNTTGPALNNIGAGTYTVTATDVLGCPSQKQIVLAEPAPLQLDLGPDRKICVGGVLTVASPMAFPTYSWTSTNGFKSDKRQVTLKDAGTYTLRVANASGCEAEDTFTLSTATDLLKADFLMVPEAYEGDTVIVIDISWPLPESITWQLPVEARVVARNSDFAEVAFDKGGKYSVSLDASIAGCQSSHDQDIEILAGPRPSKGGRVDTEELIKMVKLFPVPNGGEFTVEVELSKESGVELAIVPISGDRTAFAAKGRGARHYTWPVSVPHLGQGVYFLIVKAGTETRAVRFAKI
jgi:hypothetical protein